MHYNNTSVRDWVAEDQPIFKMQSRGMIAMTDAELLAILLGTKGLSAIDLARKLISTFGSLAALARAGTEDLCKVTGIGPAKASKIVASFEISRRKLAQSNLPTNFRDSGSVARYLQPKLGDLAHEVFHVLFLDRSHNLIDECTMFSGGTSAVTVDAKMIFKKAVDKLASSIVVCHNHPSGNTRPSPADDNLTLRLGTFATLMDIRLLDHLIISATGWYSYGDQGELVKNQQIIVESVNNPALAR